MLLGVLAGIIVFAALGLLTYGLIRTWRTVRSFGVDMAAASERVADASAGLEAAVAQTPQDHRPW